MRGTSLFLAIGLVVTLGCNGGGPSSPSTSPTTPPATSTTNSPDPQPATAQFNVLVSDGIVDNSPVPGKLRRVSFLVAIEETAGVDAHINFFRMRVWDRLGNREVDEIGASTIIATFGTNLISGGSSWVFRVSFDYNLQDLRTWELSVGLKDVNGNSSVYVADGAVTLKALEGAQLKAQ